MTDLAFATDVTDTATDDLVAVDAAGRPIRVGDVVYLAVYVGIGRADAYTRQEHGQVTALYQHDAHGRPFAEVATEHHGTVQDVDLSEVAIRA
jgi:hypothetical protein